jgi:copper chaperone CopZ
MVNKAEQFIIPVICIGCKKTVYDVIQRAGGLTSVANVEGTYQKVYKLKQQIEDLENVI